MIIKCFSAASTIKISLNFGQSRQEGARFLISKALYKKEQNSSQKVSLPSVFPLCLTERDWDTGPFLNHNQQRPIGLPCPGLDQIQFHFIALRGRSHLFFPCAIKILTVISVSISYGCWNNYHNLRGLKQHKSVILLFGNQQLKMGVTGLKSTYRQDYAPSGGSRKKNCFLIFLFSSF